jgi:hypothetical protein
VEGTEVWPGEGNMNEAPQFQGDGYHLDGQSPAIDAGTESILINGVWYDCPAYDIDGEARPYPNSNPEIGVDEVIPVGIYEPVSANSVTISLFPNPADRELTISVENGAAISEVNIYDQVGKMVYTGKPEDNTLDVSKLQSGIYILKAVTDHGESTQKIVIE